MEHREPAPVDPDLTLTRRQRRAETLRRRALSPFRITLMVLALPLTTGIIAVNIYLRTSDFDQSGAVMHLIALAGCDATQALGLGPFRKGYPGYHKRYDPDCEHKGDGRPCRSDPRVYKTRPLRGMPGRVVGQNVMGLNLPDSTASDDKTSVRPVPGNQID